MNVGNDRAWNDPPPLPFANYQGSCTKKTVLNKRVAFPLHKPGGVPTGTGDNDSDRKATCENIVVAESPPPVENTSALCSDIQDSEELIQNDVTDEEMLSFIMSTFNSLISTFAQEAVAGIQKKIAIFKDSWNGKLGEFVKKKMYCLTTELGAGNIEAADKIHHSLVVTNIREVAPWMVGVKHIIQNAQKSAPESAADDTAPREDQILDACTFHPENTVNLISL